MFPQAYAINHDMRQVALNMTWECRGNQDCVIIQLYNNLSQILVYSNTPYDGYLSPEKVWEQKSADCKSMSGLYVNMLLNMGVSAYLDANLKYKHAVAVAEPEDRDYYYVIDLTVPSIERVGNGQNHWSWFR
jgi:hypothetical protein